MGAVHSSRCDRLRYRPGPLNYRERSPLRPPAMRLGVLRRVFDYAVRDGVIQRNPAAGIRLSKVQGNDPRPLTHDELWRLAEVVDAARDRLLVLVAGYCGLRWGELAALRWSDVDLKSRTLRVAGVFRGGAAG